MYGRTLLSVRYFAFLSFCPGSDHNFNQSEHLLHLNLAQVIRD